MHRLYAYPLALAAICAALLAVGPNEAAARERNPRAAREDLRFAAEMAEKGLWREALFRWQRVLRERPDDAALQNNVAVALEALGRREEALEAYERALELSGNDKIVTNYELARRATSLGQRDEDELRLFGAQPADAPDSSVDGAGTR